MNVSGLQVGAKISKQSNTSTSLKPFCYISYFVFVNLNTGLVFVTKPSFVDSGSRLLNVLGSQVGPKISKQFSPSTCLKRIACFVFVYLTTGSQFDFVDPFARLSVCGLTRLLFSLSWSAMTSSFIARCHWSQSSVCLVT